MLIILQVKGNDIIQMVTLSQRIISQWCRIDDNDNIQVTDYDIILMIDIQADDAWITIMTVVQDEEVGTMPWVLIEELL